MYKPRDTEIVPSHPSTSPTSVPQLDVEGLPPLLLVSDGLPLVLSNPVVPLSNMHESIVDI